MAKRTAPHQPFGVQDVGPGPERLLECSDAVALAWEFVPRLRPPHQEIIRLRYSPPGMTLREVGRALGISAEGARRREATALRELRKMNNGRQGVVGAGV
jgi:RNA polymerase sigma factor (sigma-70 family)